MTRITRKKAVSKSKIIKYDYEKILDDIKIIGKAGQIMNGENNPENRAIAYSLFQDLLERLYRDTTEMKDKREKIGKTYGGKINNGKIVEEAQ